MANNAFIMDHFPFPFQATAEYARVRPDFYAPTLNKFLKQGDSTMFLRGNVRELTFDGVLDDILTRVDDFPSVLELPIPFDRFGWFYPVIDDQLPLPRCIIQTLSS